MNNEELLRELNFIAPDLTEIEKETIITDAQKVYGQPPVKLAVSLYAHGYSLEKILFFLKRQNIEMTAHKLYSLCFRNGLKKVRKKEIEPFEAVLPQDLFDVSDKIFNELKKEYYEEYKKALDNPDYMGKKSKTVARLVMKKILKRWGLA